MPRTFREETDIVIESDDDVLSLFGSAEAAMDKHLLDWGSGKYHRVVYVIDTGGEFEASTLEEARREMSTRYRIQRISLLAREEPYGRGPREVRVAARALHEDAYERWLRISVEGPDEPSVVGLARVLTDEIETSRRASRSRSASATAAGVSSGDRVMSSMDAVIPEKPAWRRLINHQWFVAIVGGLLVSAVILLITALG